MTDYFDPRGGYHRPDHDDDVDWSERDAELDRWLGWGALGCGSLFLLVVTGIIFLIARTFART